MTAGPKDRYEPRARRLDLETRRAETLTTLAAILEDRHPTHIAAVVAALEIMAIHRADPYPPAGSSVVDGVPAGPGGASVVRGALALALLCDTIDRLEVQGLGPIFGALSDQRAELYAALYDAQHKDGAP